MPNWTTAPPPRDRKHALPLLRAKPGKPIVGIITADNLLGCDTHFWHGRTTPCEAPNCDACNDGSPTRWHAYLTAFAPTANRQYILEITELASETFLAYRKTYGTLRGCQFRAARATFNPNSRVIVETKPADLEKTQLPTPPDTLACLCTIWNLPKPALQQTEKKAGFPTVKPNGKLLQTMRSTNKR